MGSIKPKVPIYSEAKIFLLLLSLASNIQILISIYDFHFSIWVKKIPK